MTTQLLANELANLVQESKRKHNDLRQAAERSLEELKSLKGASEAQVAAALSQKPTFVNPLIMACGAKNAKFTAIAIVCLQRLVLARALPRAKLDQVLEAMREAAVSGPVDAQLKILQTLPALLANYAAEVHGDLLVATLDVCFVLQARGGGGGGGVVVGNTAAATLQQVVVAIFDKVVAEDKNPAHGLIAGESPTKDGTVQLGQAALDAQKVFKDVCLMTRGQRPAHLRSSGLPQTFGLELIESVLTQHAALFSSHPEQTEILRTEVLPFCISSLEHKPNFAATVRLVRILYTLLRRHLTVLPVESGDALEVLTQLLDQDTALWKRALCMEVFRGLFAEPTLLRKIFALYDAEGGDGRKIFRAITTALARLSTEKPAVIGLGPQSTIPVSVSNTGIGPSTDQAMLETGIISAPSGPENAVNTGVSMQWSLVRVPCIDQLDKTEAPPIPESYIYSLTLTCISSLSEGLAKFILPMTVPSAKRKANRSDNGRENGRDSPALVVPGGSGAVERSASSERSASFKKNPVPINPLALEGHALHGEVKLCAAIIDECWPAILATCSTFLYAALDTEHYHGLVRAFQRIAHVAGLMQLSIPRDAFLTTLGKAAVPPNVFTACLNAGSARSSAAGGATVASPQGAGADHAGTSAGMSIFGNARGLLSVESLSAQISGEWGRQSSAGDSTATTTLNARNLLCLRALLNLGIALGPTLGLSWSIIVETLQQADLVLFCSGKSAGKTPVMAKGQDPQAEAESNRLLASFAAEVQAVEAAASRLIESTVDFPNDAFVEVVRAVGDLLEQTTMTTTTDEKHAEPFASSRPTTPLSAPRTPTHGQHRRVRSITSSATGPAQEDRFALAKLVDIAMMNIDRLLVYPPEISGWIPLISELIRVLSAPSLHPNIRAQAVDILVKLVLEAASLAAAMEAEPRGKIQLRLLEALRDALSPLQRDGRGPAASLSGWSTDVEMHRTILEGLRKVLESCGESIVAGWEVGFEIIGSIFMDKRSVSILVPPGSSSAGERKVSSGGNRVGQSLVARSSKLIRSAFSSLQLICSDFLASLPNPCFLILVDTLYKFCSQDDDLNIALTTVTFFWVLSDFLSGKNQSIAIKADVMSGTTTAAELASMAANPDHSAADAALWMLLLLRLTTVTSNDRLELRNSAIQTLLRIFDAYGDKLSPEAWSVCIKRVIFKLFTSIEVEIGRLAGEPEVDPRSRSEWNETAVVVLSGVSDLLASYLDELTAHESFDSLWRELLEHFATLLDLQALAINTATFRALSRILSQTGHKRSARAGGAAAGDGKSAELDGFGKTTIGLAWGLWARGIPTAKDGGEEDKKDNQECLLAYVSALHDVYRLMQADLDVERVRQMLILLRDAMTEATAGAGSHLADVESVSPLQGQILEAVKMVRTDLPGVPSAVVTQVAEFVSLAFPKNVVAGIISPAQQSPPSQRRTYVAMSKVSMVILESLVLTNAGDPDLILSGALASALAALARPITLKYAFPIQTIRSTPPWRQATASALAILEAMLPRLVALVFPVATAHTLWALVVEIAGGIMSADCEAATRPASVADDDERFDVTALLRLRELLVPALGGEAVPEGVRRAYAEHLFRTSIIHAPSAAEEARLVLGGRSSGSGGSGGSGTASAEVLGLADLYTSRRGRTADPVPTKRATMAYLCLDALFSLVATHEDVGAVAGAAASAAASAADASSLSSPAIMIQPPTPLTIVVPDHVIFPPSTRPATVGGGGGHTSSRDRSGNNRVAAAAAAEAATVAAPPPAQLPAEPLQRLCVRLARSAAPLLILRVALTLRAYAADHPLRGRMPQPRSQRVELLRLLRRLVGLRSEGDAIPEMAGVESEGRKHLLRLYPLLVGVGAVAGGGEGGDAEVLRLVVEALTVVGGEFGG